MVKNVRKVSTSSPLFRMWSLIYTHKTRANKWRTCKTDTTWDAKQELSVVLFGYQPIKTHRNEKNTILRFKNYQKKKIWCDSAYIIVRLIVINKVNSGREGEQHRKLILVFFFFERKSMNFYVFHWSMLRTSFRFLSFFFLSSPGDSWTLLSCC